MHINLESDYAVRIVYCLARFGQKMDAQRIAEETGVSQRFTLKIMRKLVTAGLVTSFKGAHGGYTLSRAPEEDHPSTGDRSGRGAISFQPLSG